MNGTLANQTFNHTNQWEAGAVNGLSPIVLLLILFVVCTGFMTFLIISKKKR
jgi:ABC-type spermidine/putrescine transport system permease subunit I